MLLRPVAQCLSRVGGDAAAFLAELGVDERTSVDAYVPAGLVARALDVLTGKHPGGALFLAAASPVGTLGFFDYLFVASSTLREALTRCARFYGLVTQLVSLGVEERGASGFVSHSIKPGVTRVPVLTEFAFAAFTSRARAALATPLELEHVAFTHNVGDARPYEAFFGAPVTFDAPRDELRFDVRALDFALRTADPTTVTFLEEHAARMQARLTPVDPFLDRVRQAVAAGLPARECDLSSLSRALHVSTRTLQRQLQEHGTSHTAIVADVGRELASELLRVESVSIAEVAYRLGFTEQAAFHRAFVRWTGTTPGAFRARARTAASRLSGT